MEQIDKTHIAELTIAEILGTLTPQQAEELHELIGNNQEAFETWKSVHADFENKEDVSNALSTYAKRVTGEDIMRIADSRKRKPRVLLSIAAAACLLIAMAVALFLYKLQRPGADGGEHNYAAASPKLQLQLQDGPVVDLTRKDTNQSLQGLHLNYDSNELSYDADAGHALRWAVLQIPNGMNYKLKLADGSEVFLNAATTVRFPFSFTGATREITVNGEAYLKIKKNERIPFIVHLQQSKVRVLGTEFNVNNYEDGTDRVSLVKGSVLLNTGTDSARIGPGHELISRKGHPLLATTFDENDVLAWMQGQYVFKNVPMRELPQIIKRHCGVNVILDNKAHADRIFTGSLDRATPIRSFAEVLKATRVIVDFYFSADSTLHLK